MLPTRSDRVSSFLRTFAIQGSWNYRTLVAGGLTNAMLPLLRRIYAGDPVGLREAVERHMKPFNGHPYLCPMAVTALARLENDGVSEEQIVRFRRALRAPLGALGDELVWATWRPFCVLMAITFFWLSERPWAATLGFLLLYNSGHIALRAWAFRRGWTGGLSVGRDLRNAPWAGAVRWLTSMNLLLVGAAVVLVSSMVDASLFGRWEVTLAVGVSLVIGYARPALGERMAPALLIVAPLVLLLMSG